MATQPTILRASAAAPDETAQPKTAAARLAPTLVVAKDSATAVVESQSGSFAALDQSLRAGLDRARNGLCEVGYYGYRISQTADWAAHGYESEDHYRESLGVSAGMWRDYTSLGAKLAHLSLADMQALTVAAARSLARVRADLWHEFPWIEEAKLLPAGEFDSLVKTRQRRHQRKALREPREDIRMAVPASQRAQLEQRLESLRTDCQLATLGESLALALAAAEKLSRLAKTSPAAAAALTRSISEARRACAEV